MSLTTSGVRRDDNLVFTRDRITAGISAGETKTPNIPFECLEDVATFDAFKVLA